MKRITIKDIAKEFGVHHSTVSRALRGSSDINAATRSAIVQYARDKGYQINRNALHLRGAGSNIIGVVVPNIHHSFFRSEEHTSELQSRPHLVCRLLLEKKKQTIYHQHLIAT